MEVEVLYNVGSKISVRVDMTIVVGQQCRINPSYGYAGIDPGIVTVTHILSSSTIMEIAGDDDAGDLVPMIESYKDAHLSLFTNRDNSPDPEYGEQLRYLDTTDWIVYQYNSGSDICVFPIAEFIAHISQI